MNSTIEPAAFQQDFSALAKRIADGQATTPADFARVEQRIKQTSFPTEAVRTEAARNLGGLRLLAAVLAVG